MAGPAAAGVAALSFALTDAMVVKSAWLVKTPKTTRARRRQTVRKRRRRRGRANFYARGKRREREEGKEARKNRNARQAAERLEEEQKVETTCKNNQKPTRKDEMTRTDTRNTRDVKEAYRSALGNEREKKKKVG